jgi:hypothetical protein
VVDDVTSLSSRMGYCGAPSAICARGNLHSSVGNPSPFLGGMTTQRIWEWLDGYCWCAFLLCFPIGAQTMLVTDIMP